MNDPLVEHWIQELGLNQNKGKILSEFSTLMDRNSLFLMKAIREGDHSVFVYTDEADHYKFTLGEMEQLLKNMDQGQSLDWNLIEKNNRVNEH